MQYLLDTNHCIYLLNGLGKPRDNRSQEEKNVLLAVRSVNSSDFLCMSEATLGELYYGAALSQRKSHNIEKIEILTEMITPLRLKKEVRQLFGETKADLRKKGKQISDFDLLIACTAKTHNCVIVTNDSDFDVLPNKFPLINWAGKEV